MSLFLIREAAAKVDARDCKGRTPLMWASCLGLVDVVRHLILDSRADVTARDAEGNNVAAIAASGGQVEVVAFLITECGIDIECKYVYTIYIHIYVYT